MSIVELNRACQLLLSGEVLGLPTETVYGLAGRIDREETLKKIFAVKERPLFDPLIVHVADRAQAQSLAADWPNIFDDLTKAFWPGPLTLITRKAEHISPLITSGLESVGLRCPNHPLALEVLKRVGVPLAAPSANRFGRTSPTSASDVETEFSGSVPVLDGGNCIVGVESTVLQVENVGARWRLHILRPGGVSRQQLRQVLEPKYQIEILRSSSVASPGSMKTHYQPRKPLFIVAHEKEVLPADVAEKTGHTANKVAWLKLDGTPEVAARTLYSDFRRLADSADVILVRREKSHHTEMWEAVWDRIERASSGHFA